MRRSMTNLLLGRRRPLSTMAVTPAGSKVYRSSIEAVSDIKSGSSIACGGFGLCGIPENCIRALRYGPHVPSNLDIISNDAGTADYGLGLLISNRQVSRMRASYVGENRAIVGLLVKGVLELELIPQGTLAEKLRSGGAGMPAIWVPTGVNTLVQYGNLPTKYDSEGNAVAWTAPKESREFNGRQYLLEATITTDFALIKGFKADTLGNVVFRSTARNFNPDCARAARCCIVEVEEIVPAGSLHPDEIHLPGIYVHRVVLGETFERRIEKVTTRPRSSDGADGNTDGTSTTSRSQAASLRSPAHHRIARRAAREFRDGMSVNLGIGIPTLTANYIPGGMQVDLQSENGLMKMGPYPFDDEEPDADLINAGKECVTYLPGSSVFSSSDSFAMIRAGRIDLTILGTLEVSGEGDVANWIIPGKKINGMGGAMDLVAACKRVVVVTTHTQKDGTPKVLRQCSLPLTGKGVAALIITELAVFAVLPERQGLMLMEHADGVSVDEIRKKTDAPFVLSPALRPMLQ